MRKRLKTNIALGIIAIILALVTNCKKPFFSDYKNDVALSRVSEYID